MKCPLLFFLLVICSSAMSETARWPLRIVETSYTVNTLTGAEFGHKAKEKSSVVAVDIAKATKNGVDSLTFTRRVTKSMEETESETGKAEVPFTDRQKLIDAVAKAKAYFSKPATTAADSEEILFTGDTLGIVFMCKKKKRYLQIAFGEDCTFELESVHVSQFLDLLKRIK